MSVFSICFDNMYRIVFITLFGIAAWVGGADIEKCKALVTTDVLRCCTKFPFEKTMTGDIAGCGEPPKDIGSCTREICLGTKIGYANSEGKIDKAKLEEVMTKEFGSETKVLEAIKSDCIYGDLEIFGPPDHCDLIKLKNCFMFHFITKCPEWNEEGNCKGKKESVEECSTLLS